MNIQGTNSVMTFLIDTGADVSLCKENTVRNYEEDPDDYCLLTGISKDRIKSLGSTIVKIPIGEAIVNHKIQLVAYDFPIATDGILGRDFLCKYNCNIDYEKYILTVNAGSESVIFPIHDRTYGISWVKIPPRSEVILPFKLDLEEDGVVCSREIAHGIFLANSIVPKTGNQHIRLLNVLDKTTVVRNLKVDTIPLRNYDIYRTGTRKGVHSEQRFQKLMSELNIDSDDENAKRELIDILKEYQSIFHLDGEHLTTNNFYSQTIQLNDNSPVYIKNYRLPQAQTEEIHNQVKGLLREGIIEPSVSPYNAPLLLVPKKGQTDLKKWRLVVDFRKLNDKIVNDKFPLTRLDDILDKLGRAKYFSTLDMTSSFHQIELEPDSRPFTAFSTLDGHYQYTRLPFGLKISSNSFQRMLTIALSGLESEAFLYVDDIIVFGCSLKHHNRNLVNVFDRLARYNLKLNAGKCCFLKPEVVYLGHLITSNGIKPDPGKFEAITKYPIPKNADDVRRFVAFCNYYRRFIKNFADIASCLNNLLKKNVKFEWTEECQVAFEKLKANLISPPILQYPDFEKPFVLTTDASDFALGAVLSQGTIGEDLPISYASKSLNRYEKNKPVIEKELLAIHWGIQFFRPYLYGRKFTVVTDHRPLISLFSHKNPSSKLTRIRLELSDYDFNIVYKKGANNTNADALSRIQIDSETLKEMIPHEIDETVRKTLVITRGMSKKTQEKESRTEKQNEKSKEDREIDATEENCNSHNEPDQLNMWECTSFNDIKRAKRIKFMLEEDLGTSIRITDQKSLNEIQVRCSDNSHYFDNVLKKLLSTLEELKYKNYALNRSDNVFNMITHEVLKEKVNKLKVKDVTILLYNDPQRITNVEKQKELIELYHDTPSGGHFGVRKTLLKLKQKYIWKNMYKMVKKHVSTCDLCQRNKQVRHTREPFCITDTPTQSFETIVIDTVGPLRPSGDYRYILTMQCELTKYVIAAPMETKEAVSIAKTLVENLILKYGLFRTLKSDRGTEFTNELLKEICGLLKIEQKFSTPYHHETLGTVERNHRVLNEYFLSFVGEGEWHSWIPYYTFAYNITPYVDTEYSPFELIFGKLPSLPGDQITNCDRVYNLDNYANELKIRLKNSLENARKLIEIVKDRRMLDSHNNANKIKLEVGDWVLVRLESRKKNESPYHGPYEIVDIDDLNVYIKIKNNIKAYHKNLLKKYNTK